MITEYYWKNKQGDIIPIDNMEMVYLRNALKMMIRHSPRTEIENRCSDREDRRRLIANAKYIAPNECDATEIDLY